MTPDPNLPLRDVNPAQYHWTWNSIATDEAFRLSRPFNYWPKDHILARTKKALLVHIGPTGRVSTGGHTQ